MSVNAQNVNIPDEVFKNYLLSDDFINTNNDTEIQLSEAIAYNSEISCEELGIEVFINLQYLFCYDNNLTTLDLTSNTALIDLECHLNPLTSINVSTCTDLETLTCTDTDLTSLDLSPNVTLIYISGSLSQLVGNCGSC